MTKEYLAEKERLTRCLFHGGLTDEEWKLKKEELAAGDE